MFLDKKVTYAIELWISSSFLFVFPLEKKNLRPLEVFIQKVLMNKNVET